MGLILRRVPRASKLVWARTVSRTNLTGPTGFSPPMLEAWVMVLGGSSVALQLSSQRSNVDFKPIVDHYSAVEYATKYATKKEKGSKPFDRWCARLNSGGRAEAESVAQSVAAEESSVLQYIATCVNAVALVLVGVLLERARSRSAVTPVSTRATRAAMLRVGADALLALGAVRTTRPGTTRPPGAHRAHQNPVPGVADRSRAE